MNSIPRSSTPLKISTVSRQLESLLYSRFGQIQDSGKDGENSEPRLNETPIKNIEEGNEKKR